MGDVLRGAIGAMAVVLGACTESPDVACDQSLLYRDSGYQLAAPAGTQFAPTVIFSDTDGQRPGECHYARNQGDEVCTEPGGWVDLNPGAKDGTIMVTPHSHACGGFAVDSTYVLAYSFTMVPSRLWIESWSSNQ
jgi:hypothetical protein